jgi:hypothetical protein
LPIFEEKITFNLIKETDKKIIELKSRFVEHREMELNLTDIK